MTPKLTGAAVPNTMRLARAALLMSALMLSLLTGRVLAQSFAFNAVDIQGNQRVADSTILSFGGISRGESVTADQLNTAAQKIRDTGLFESVDVQARGATLEIRVVEFPTINQISIEGNRRLADAEFLPLIESQPRKAYSPAIVERDVARVTGLYAKNGRINASVTPRIIRLSENRVNIVFEVQESGVTEVQRITFVGNRSFSDRRLRGVLETKQAGLLRAIISRDTYSEDRVNFDRQVLTDFYQSRGFADFTLQNVDVTLTRARDAYLITFNIQEGQRFTFGNVAASSDLPEVDVESFRRALTTRTGMSYSPGQIDRDIARLERLAIQRGLTFIAVEPQITRNDRDLSLNVDYKLVRGPRIFVERIDIEGNSTTLDRVVRNQFRTVEGDPFNPREIRQAADRIRALGFFTTADVNAREGTTPEQVIVDVNVDEAPTGSLSFGANYNTDNGVGLVASFREANFLGRGQSLSFQVSTATANRIFDFNFSEPNFLGRDLRAGIDLTYRTTNNQNADYDTKNFRISPSLSFPVSESGRISTFVALSYDDLSGDLAGISPFIQQEADLEGIFNASVGYSYSFDNRRTGLDPTAGYVLRFGQEFAFGDTQFIKTSALVAAERKVLNEDVTLRATVEGGHLSYQKGFSRVTDRYFLSGNSFRGFDAKGMGPRDFDPAVSPAINDALGGNSYAVARLEAEFPLGLPEEYGISGGVFADYGSVWDVGRAAPGTVLYNGYTPRATAGVSIFWTTPLGPLRFNFTEPLMAEDQDKTKAFDITISTSF